MGTNLGRIGARGKSLPVIDALIAATGLVHGLVVVTRNVADLERCGARCLNPWGEAGSARALQTAPTARERSLMTRISIDLDRRIGTVDPRIFGQFIEHLGRCIYGGIYDEGSPLSDARGFRRDVLEAARPLAHPRAALARRATS